MANKSDTYSKKQTVKPGRTLLVKVFDKTNLDCIDSLEGFTSKHHAVKSNSYFITFTTAEQSNNAMNQLKTQFGPSINVKFAQYRIYFTMKGIAPDADYGFLKSTHCDMVTTSANCNVLYYRLYRKNNTYIGCGDMTIDTKDGFDCLMNQFKNYTLNSELSGIHYRYNKVSPEQNLLQN